MSCIERDFPSGTLPSEAGFVQAQVEPLPGGGVHRLCLADFNGDGATDYAVLIREPSKGIYVVVHLVESGTFKGTILDTVRDSSTGINVALSVLGKGAYEGVEDSLVIQNPAIDVEFLDESLAKTYHWSQNQFVPYYWD